METQIYGESDDSWSIYVNDKLRCKYTSSFEVAEHLANLIEKHDRLLEVTADAIEQLERLRRMLVDIDASR